MSEVNVHVTDFVPEFIELVGGASGTKAFPTLMARLNVLAYQYMEMWRSFASGHPIPGISETVNSRGDYVRSINVDVSNADIKYVYTDSPHHKYIEDGHGEIDLKPGLLTGPKARQGKNGPYNIVSFRHGTPNTSQSNRPMPVNIFQIMQKETKKAETEKKQAISEVNQRKSPTERKTAWGARVPKDKGGKAETKTTSKGKYKWKSGKYAGMTRVQASTSKASSSKYITFRVVSIKSPPSSWRVPGRDGIPIRQAVVDTMRPIAEEMIAEAIEMDLS